MYTAAAMLSPRTSLAVTAFLATKPDLKLLVPASSLPKFDVYVANQHTSRVVKFVELDPVTWSVPPIKRSCVDTDVILLWLVAKSGEDDYHFIHAVLDDIDECVVEEDLNSKRYVKIVPPYDRHVSEWLCGSHESCALPPLASHASWHISAIPRHVFSRDVWASLAHDATGEPPFSFTS